MTRPIATKEIKHRDKVYKLELWSPINDKLPNGHFEPPTFRKDFFNDADMSGTWPNAGQGSRYQERFDRWFDDLPSDRQRMYARAIDESNRIIISMVWDLLMPVDRHELFNNNLRQFSSWFTQLEVADVDFYMTRIMSKRRLMPREFNTNTEVLTEEEVTSILEQVYDKIDDDLIRATSINGLLCISCTDETRLKLAKQHMIKHGSILRDYRKKQNSSGRVIYTYIFSKP